MILGNGGRDHEGKFDIQDRSGGAVRGVCGDGEEQEGECGEEAVFHVCSGSAGTVVSPAGLSVW